MWSRPPTDTRRSASFRASVTNVVSKIGISISSTGTAIDETMPRWACDSPTQASTASVDPRNKLPESPMKIVAGLKLNRRKPAPAPAIAAATAKTPGSPCREDTHTATAVTTAMPAQRPSMLSSRLKAFAVPTIQSTVISALVTCDPVHGSVTPRLTIVQATAIWTMSLTTGRRPLTSSTMPRLKSAVPAPSTTQVW